MAEQPAHATVNTTEEDTEPLVGTEDHEVLPVSCQPWKKARSCVLATIFLIGGLMEGVMGPSQVDLIVIFSCNYAQLGQAIMAKGFGILFGSLLGGYVVDHFRPRADLLSGVVALVFGLASAAFPWTGYLWLGGLSLAVCGICQAYLNVAISCLCMCLWGDKAAAPLHMMHAGFTITMTIAPFLTTPFLSQNITASANATLMHHLPGVVPRELNSLPELLGDATVNRIPELLGNATVTEVPMIETASRVWIPYAMIGGLGLLSSVGFFVIYTLCFRYDPPRQQQSANRSYTLRSLCRCRRENVYPVYFLCSLFILYLLNRGRINSTNLFLFPIAASPPLSFSHTLSASVNMLYSGAQVVGRVVIGGLSHWLHMAPLLWIQSVCLLVTHVLLSILALDGALQFWILSGLCGVWNGPAYPSIVAWANSYLEVHGYVMAIIDLGIGAGTFISSWLSGYLFEYYGSAYVFYLCAAASGIVLIVLVPLQIVASKHGDRHREENERMN